MPLFTFNDAYISAVAGGASDEDTIDLFAEAFEEMGKEVRENLPQTLVFDWDEDGPYVTLSQQQMDEEFGTDEEAGNGNIRRGFLRSVLPASKAFAEVIHG